MRLALHGASGRMGLAITRLAAAEPGWQLVGACAGPADPALGRDLGELAGVGTLGVELTADLGASVLGAEVLIDFSTASAVATVAGTCARAGVALMSGTTNLDEAAQAALTRAAERVPVLWASNTSLGVQVLAELTERALERLGPGWDVELVELHHRKKLDAPSGTARRLLEVVRGARPELRELRGRDGEVGARTEEEVGVFGVRGGDVVGEHTVYLFGPGERLELTHRATHRELFAHGALRAARFLIGRSAGRYQMADVLGASSATLAR